LVTWPAGAHDASEKRGGRLGRAALTDALENSVQQALARIPKQEADQAREAQLARLQAVRMLLWNQASADPIRAAEALIKLEAREARLLGLDMPTKVAMTDPDGGIPLETIRRVMERVDRQMVDVTPEPAPIPLDQKKQ
jgi:hypothetical protein